MYRLGWYVHVTQRFFLLLQIPYLIVTRQAADPLNVKIPAARLDLRKNFFSVRVCEKWNNLPSDINAVLTRKASRGTTGDIRETTRPKQETSHCRMQETNGTRPDEQFPAGPYLGRWESFYK